MHSGKVVLAVAILMAAVPQIRAQVLAPQEILDPAMRALQQKHLPELKAAAVDIATHNYPQKFYLSRTLDVTEKQEQQTDQRSIRFSNFQGHTVLQVTGNYFAAYPDQSMDRKERVRRTYLDVMLPILRATAPRLQNEPELTAFAIEISHHVRKQVMGITMERPENLVLVVPREAAEKVAGSNGINDLMAVLSQSNVYVDGEPLALWPGQEAKAPEKQLAIAAPAATPAPPPPAVSAAVLSKLLTAPVEAGRPPAQTSPAAAPVPARDLSPEALQQGQAAYQGLLDRIVLELDAQAHFITYAPPALVAFRNASYLQLSIATTLAQSDSGSQYRIAALAFDRHVSHLIRPIMVFFKEGPQFDGIVFSSTVHLPGESAGAALTESVEFFFPMSELRRYEQYDITGQQLINSGFVLINGERVGLELQSAESDMRK
jgi:hypothetical protein